MLEYVKQIAWASQHLSTCKVHMLCFIWWLNIFLKDVGQLMTVHLIYRPALNIKITKPSTSVYEAGNLFLKAVDQDISISFMHLSLYYSLDKKLIFLSNGFVLILLRNKYTHLVDLLTIITGKKLMFTNKRN